MSVGDPRIQAVNVSRPQLLHATSEQSIAASDDFYSFSEHATEGSSLDDESQVTVVRYLTPPSQTRITNTSQGETSSLSSIPSTAKRLFPLMAPTPPSVRMVSEGTDYSQPPSQGLLAPPKTNFEGERGLTPGVDDTPYIRFAIDQLTRDEEVSADGRASRASEASYPVDRIIPDEGLGYLPPRAQRADREDPSRELPRRSEEGPEVQDSEVFIPVQAPEDTIRYPRLDYLPVILRPLTLCALMLCCWLMTAALIFCGVWSAKHSGLWDYDGIDRGRYFVFQFLPQMLACLILIWLFNVEMAVCRILPFSHMASNSAKSRSGALFMDLFPTDFILPRLRYFRAGDPVIGICMLVFWLTIFTIPLQSSVFQAQYLIRDGSGLWRWTTVRPIIWLLVGLYALLSAAVLGLIVALVTRPSGLKWDPTSLADLIVLLQRSNVVDDYEGSETFRDQRKFRSRLNERVDRLGYWKTTSQPENIFYGIGEEGAATRRYSIQYGRISREKPTDSNRQSQDPTNTSFDLEGQRALLSSADKTLAREIFSPAVRHRYIPWYLRPLSIITWTIIAFALLVAFITVSFVNHAIQHGFHPGLGAQPNALQFSSANFLYSFIPSLIGLLLFLVWQPLDLTFRFLQPYADLSAHPDGSLAEHSLLLDYPSCLPLEITLKATVARHFKVALLSLMSIVSAVFPILGGGVFWAELYEPENRVRMTSDLSAFYALVAFAVIYAISLLAIWRPGSKRHLPHGARCLAEVISFIYQSPLLADPVFRSPRSKTDLVTRLLAVPVGETERARYGFGVYRGRDGREHLGIDRVKRPGGVDMIVTQQRTMTGRKTKK
ncbi:MAG: hypothetical protein M1819_003685 [Sarea resinae]|nr:MAG: hypothetical protein M1819_003685 [Sarea resinae]